MNLHDLRRELADLLPNTTIDVVGFRPIVHMPVHLYFRGISVRDDGTDFKLGATDVPRPTRTGGKIAATAKNIHTAIQECLRACLVDMRSRAACGGAQQRNTYAKALNTIAASDFNALALEHLDDEAFDVNNARVQLEAEVARRTREFDAEAADIAERRRALVMKAPGYKGPVLEALSSYTDAEPLLDDDDINALGPVPK